MRTYPVVDNVIYMASGARLLDAARVGGMRGLISAYLQSPPHAPYSTFSSMLGYAVFGYRDIGPHIVAGLVPLVGLLMVWWVARSPRLHLWERAAIVLAAACVPIWANAVEYLKPDLCCGLLSAVGCAVLLARVPGRLQWRPLLMSGAVFGLALLTKPAVFPQTLWFMFAAFGSRAIMDRFVGERMFAWRRVLQGLALAGVAIGLALPHYLIALPRITRYIDEIMFGSQRPLWEYRGGIVDHVHFHLTGRGGQQFLGVPGWIMLGIAVLSAVVMLRRQGRARIAIVAGWGGMLVAAYVPPMVNHFKNPQFAACFQFLVVFAGVLAFAALLKQWRATRVRTVLALAITGACIATATWTFPRYSPAELSTVDQRTALVREIYRAATEDLREPRALLILGPLGHVNHNLFSLWSVRDRLPLRTSLLRAPLSGDALDQRLAGADMVLIGVGQTDMVSTTVAKPGIAEHLWSEMSARPAWPVVRRFPAPGATGWFELRVRQKPHPAAAPDRSDVVDDEGDASP
ncbi:MAG: hypothetical protein K2W85_16105 [Phycisphaerales bacterium]|nr:hypothetical protein [Phycisphaerales bacterium]